MDKNKNKETDLKMMYELSKLTNSSKQITDDFLESVILYLFKEYISCLSDKSTFLVDFMNQWEESVLLQKTTELDALTTQYNTMDDLVLGSYIANSENMEHFKKEVSLIKDVLMLSLMKVTDE